MPIGDLPTVVRPVRRPEEQPAPGLAEREQPLPRVRLEPLVLVDYLVLVHPHTLADVPEWYRGEALLAVAARVGTTDPFALFEEWLAEARLAEPNDPTAMALATAYRSAGRAASERRFWFDADPAMLQVAQRLQGSVTLERSLTFIARSWNRLSITNAESISCRSRERYHGQKKRCSRGTGARRRMFSTSPASDCPRMGPGAMS